MSVHREEEVLLAECAADWLRRLQAGDATENAAFMAWLKESPRHVREILLLTTWDKLLEHCDPQHHFDVEELHGSTASNVVTLQTDAPAGGRKQMTRLWTLWRLPVAIGAVAVAVVLGVVLPWGLLDALTDTYTTAIGEQRSVTLTDGSVMQLNTRSRLRVDYASGTRDVYLLKGQALFKVAHNAARPFRVHIGDAVIQAVGTQFDVYRRTDRTTVTVVEGVVRVLGDSARTLTAGEATNVVAGGHVTDRKLVDVVDATAWRQRRLVFRKDSLAYIAAEFNRYNRAPQIRVEGEALGARQFNGVFDADDPQSLLLFLKEEPDLAFETRGGELIIRLRETTSVATDRRSN